MASFKGILSVGAFSTDVNFFHLSIYQHTDSLGRPASRTKGGTMTIEFNSTDDNVINEWMINPAMRQDGKVVFKQINSPITLREVSFFNAYCVSMIEQSNAGTGSGQIITTIVISPERVQTGAIQLDKKWPATE